MADLNWHARSGAEVVSALASADIGLTSAEAAARLERFGPNRLPRQRPPTVWQIVWGQCQNPLIYVLVLAAVASLLVGEWGDAIFIAMVIAINALIGAYQEWQAERSSRALEKLLRIRASVLRDGDVKLIDAEEVVPGDMVSLESGNRVPADLRLLTTHGLEIDESLLTGESLAVLKNGTANVETQTAVGDRVNMAYAGAIVVRGRARGVVVATGSQTMVGQLALDVTASAGGKPPLLERMERFSQAIALVTVVGAAVVALVGILVHGYPVVTMVFFAIALAVAIIPEGLPASLTVALGVATSRMARRGVIVRRLAAVEGLGSCTLIASDKTGTLTCNQLTVRQVRLPGNLEIEVTGEGYAPAGEILCDRANDALIALARAAVLCNEGTLSKRDGTWVWHGDPTDIALLSFAHKTGTSVDEMLADSPKVNHIPFEPEHQFAASVHRIGDRQCVFVKGAPEKVLSMCGEDRPDWHAEAKEMAERGFRVIALAEGDVPDQVTETTVLTEPAGCRFLGFVGMIDPLRPGVKEAVAACHRAGIRVVMITGDHPSTARAIARDLGMDANPEQVVLGRELQGRTPGDLEQVMRHALVFARVAPAQKLELVQAAQRVGHFVAVTGDGINDAPALRAANIGVAMGKSGTDVAREAAPIVLSDDNFATIIAGVEEGRIAYDNVRNVIFLLISFGAAELVALGSAVAFGLPLPLLPMQVLWLNLVTNGIQGVALAFEPGDRHALLRPPRPPREPIFNRLMIERVLVSALVMGGICLLSFWWMLRSGWSEPSARNVLLLLLVIFVTVHVGNARSEARSAFYLSPLKSLPVLVGSLTALLIHVLVIYLPIGQSFLRTEPVDLTTWGVLLLLSLSVLAAMELHRLLWNLRHATEGS